MSILIYHLKQFFSQAKEGVIDTLSNAGIEFFPLKKTIRNYNRDRLMADIKSAINVALLAFPQGMAYAMIAGLPIHFGIYVTIVAAIVAVVFGKSPFLSFGATNSTAVLLMSTFATLSIAFEQRPVILPLIIVMTGLFLVIGSLFNIANLINFVSRSVITGYITAAALLLIANQASNLLGYTFPDQATTFYHLVKYTLVYISSTHWPSVLISLMTFSVYFLVNRFLPLLPNVALTLIIMSFVGMGFSVLDWPLTYLQPFDITTWKVRIPEINFSLISQASQAAFALSILALLESASIGKSLSAKSGRHFFINQETLSLGFANICCGFLSGMPVSSSLTRSTLNYTSGARTVLSSFYCGLICLIISLMVGDLINYVPQSSLAVIVVVIGCSLIYMRAIRVVIQATPRDAVVFMVTLFSALLIPLDTAIILGVLLSIILFLRRAAIPQMIEYIFTPEGQLAELPETEQRPDPEISIVHVEGNLFFGATDLFQEQLRRVCEDPNLKVVILKTRNAYHFDATSVLALEELAKYMRAHNRVLLISEARKEVVRILKKTDLISTIGEENIFPDCPENPTLSTARALHHAQDLLGTRKARVSIFFDAPVQSNLEPKLP